MGQDVFRSIVFVLKTESFELIACLVGESRAAPFSLRLQEQSERVTANVKSIVNRVMDAYQTSATP